MPDPMPATDALLDPAPILAPEIDFGRDPLPDLHAQLDALRAAGPVVRVQYLGAPVWLILGHAELAEAFGDLEAFDPADGYRLIGEPSMGRTIQTMTGEEHRRSRGLVAPAFAPAAVRAHIESVIEPAAQRLLARLEGADEIDLVEAFTRPFPFTVITSLLGIPVEDEGLFLEWAVKLIDYPWDPEGALKARAEFSAYMQPLIDGRRAAPASDFISILTEARFEGERLDDEAILSFLRLLFPAGSDTTYKAGGSLFAAVLPDAALRARALIGERERMAMVVETLRWQPPVANLPRLATGDRMLGGAQIRKGDWVLFGIAAANSDPAVFAEPRRFDPDRAQREPLWFGRGIHFCLGHHLARRELETALRLAMGTYPDLRLASDAPVVFAGGVLRGPAELIVRPGRRAAPM